MIDRHIKLCMVSIGALGAGLFLRHDDCATFGIVDWALLIHEVISQRCLTVEGDFPYDIKGFLRACRLMPLHHIK